MILGDRLNGLFYNFPIVCWQIIHEEGDGGGCVVFGIQGIYYSFNNRYGVLSLIIKVNRVGLFAKNHL